MALNNARRTTEYLSTIKALEGAGFVVAVSACRGTVIVPKAVTANEFVHYRHLEGKEGPHFRLQRVFTRLGNRRNIE